LSVRPKESVRAPASKAAGGPPRTGADASALHDAIARFSDTEPLADFAYLHVAAQVAELTRGAAAAAGGPADAEGVHKMRVATRRARSALRSFRAVLPESLRAYGRELRWLARVLGAVRDLDVYRDRCLSLSAGLPALDAAALERHDAAVERDRRRAADELNAALESRRCRRLLGELSAAVAGPPPPTAGPTTREGAQAYIAKARRQVLKQGRSIDRDSPPEQLHALRIKDKRFRYLLEFFMPLYGSRLKTPLRASIRLQDLLGQHQDACVADARLRIYAETVPVDAAFRAELLALGELVAAERASAVKARQRFAKEWRRFKADVAALTPAWG
jgi:CHAD domain-containing protein